MIAAEIARALGGHRSTGGYLVRCPVPSHGQGQGDRRPSLMVKDGERRLLVKCFAGCAADEILQALRDRGLSKGQFASAVHRLPASRRDPDRWEVAVAIWASAAPIVGTLAETYLQRHRGLTPPFPPSLRYLNQQVPTALVAAAHWADDSLGAVQITYLSSSGMKAAVSPNRRTVGSLGDGAVRLGDAEWCLGLAEGIEDALAASHLSGVPCWACLGASRMHRVAIPATVRELHIFADDDGPGREAAERTADLHRQLGRRVVLRLPPAGLKDWGEVAQRRQVAG